MGIIKKILFTFAFIGSFNLSIAEAKNLIFMLGDGMGTQHILCGSKNKPMYISSLPVQGIIHTKSSNSDITDSAASATAYSCGVKTNNHYLGKLPNNTICQTIAEEAVQRGVSVGIYSTDLETGASPSAFYSHTRDRNNVKKIKGFKQIAERDMDILVPSGTLSNIIDVKLNTLKNKNQPFFAFFEEAYIDKESHENNYQKMLNALYDFDLSVWKVVEFANKNPGTTVIVLADHETGGLTENCMYTTRGHTGTDVSIFAYGSDAALFQGEQDNTEVYQKMRKILFDN